MSKTDYVCMEIKMTFPYVAEPKAKHIGGNTTEITRCVPVSSVAVKTHYQSRFLFALMQNIHC